MLLSDYITQLQFLLHDQSNADFSTSELTAAINNARTATSLDFHCCRAVYLTPPNQVANPAIYTPVSIIQNQEVYPLNGAPGNSNTGQVVGAVVTNPGSNYTAPVVTFDAGPTGSIPAQGQAVLSSTNTGQIASINVTQWGTGYVPALPGSSGVPQIKITDPTGSGAAAIAVMFNNVFNVISISNIWGNQRYMLKFRGFTLFQAYMRSQLFFTQRPIIWTIHEQAGFVLIQPPPDQAYQTEWDVLVTPLPLVNPGDSDTQILPPYNDAVQYYAASYCLNKLQNFNQAEYMLKLYSARVPKIIIGAGGVRIPNPYHKTFQRRVMR
jgi:hypothetical protein